MMMNSKLGKAFIFSLCASTFMLSGCVPQHEIKQRAAIKKKVAKDEKKAEKSFSPPVIPKPGKVETYDQFYADRIPRTADWLQKSVHFKGDTQLKTFIKQSLQGTGIIPLFQNGADPDKTIHVNIDGTVQDLLHQLHEQTGYDFQTSDHGLVISDMITRTFHISSVPGESDYDVGKTDEQYAIGSINSDTSSGGSSGDSQHNQEKGQISVWKDIQGAIKGLISADGKLDVSQSASAVTVTDHARQVEAVAKWVKSYNAILNQQVHFKVQVITVNLDDANNRNFNFSLGNIFKLADGSDNNPTAVFGGGSTDSGMAAPNSVGSLNDSGQSLVLHGGDVFNFMMKMLSEQGRTTEQDSSVLTSVNNHVAQLRQTLTTTYLSQVKVTHDDDSGGGGGSSGSSDDVDVTPGQVTTGYELYILPHIDGQQVKMKVTMNLSNLIKMSEVKIPTGGSSGGSGTTTPTTPTTPTTCPNGGTPPDCTSAFKTIASTILGGNSVSSGGIEMQFPQIETRKFNQDAIVSNGDTLVLGGFKTNLLWMGANNNFNSPLFGSYQAARQNTILIFLITPYITEPQTQSSDVSDNGPEPQDAITTE